MHTTPTLPATMRAAVRERYGTPDVVTVETLPVPTPDDDEVLVEVHAAGVDRGVWHLVTGLPYAVRIAGYGITAPKHPVPGLDVAGRVVAVGRAVTRFRPGDDVYGIARGSYAEYAIAQEHKVASRPTSLDARSAATVPVSGLTALQAVTDVGGARAGQRVLVLGASGGVGSYVVQIAKALGAEVTGVASTAKLDLVRSLGADRVVDYTSQDALDGGAAHDLIVDTGGRNPLTKLRRALTPHGTLVIVGGEGGGRWTGGAGRQLRAMAWSPFVGQRLTTLISKERFQDLERLTELIDAGAVTPAVDRDYPLDHVADALHDLAAGSVRGKTVIHVRSES